MADKGPTIEDYYHEGRTFAPPAAFVEAAVVNDPTIYERADADFEGFWAEQARELVSWDEPFHTDPRVGAPDARWFVGGKLNIAYNCLDRHVEAGRGDKVALHSRVSPATPAPSPTPTCWAR